MPQISTRVGKFTDSVIRRMTRISNRYGAINLSQGFPDFDPPKALTDALAETAVKGPHQYSITGWRLGYIIAPAPFVEAARKVHDFLTVGAAAPLQAAAVAGLKLGDEYYRDLNRLYRGKRDRMLEGLDSIGIKHNIPQGAYFIMLDIQEFLETDRFAGYSDLEFCEWMIREIGVAAVPGSSFFKEDVNRYIRLHFARGEEIIDEAIRRLVRLNDFKQLFFIFSTAVNVVMRFLR